MCVHVHADTYNMQSQMYASSITGCPLLPVVLWQLIRRASENVFEPRVLARQDGCREHRMYIYITVINM